MTNYYKALSFVAITALLGGFNLLYGMHDIPYIIQEVIYFVPFFSIITWIGIIFWKDFSFIKIKSEKDILRGIILTTCLLLLSMILLNLVGLKYFEPGEARNYGYKEFRAFIDLPIWNYLSLGLLLITLTVIAIKTCKR